MQKFPGIPGGLGKWLFIIRIGPMVYGVPMVCNLFNVLQQLSFI